MRTKKENEILVCCEIDDSERARARWPTGTALIGVLHDLRDVLDDEPAATLNANGVTHTFAQELTTER